MFLDPGLRLKAPPGAEARRYFRSMPQALAGALVFLTSAAVLVLEILAGRLLAPYVGITLETYTGIIGTVLAGIALGTWAGGRLADRLRPAAHARPALHPVAGRSPCSRCRSSNCVGAASQGSGRDAAIVTALPLVGFFAPAAVLCAVSPMVVKLQLRDLDRDRHGWSGGSSALGHGRWPSSAPSSPASCSSPPSRCGPS